MSLLTFIIVLAAAGVLMWAINRWAPMEPEYKRFFNIAVMVFMFIWLLQMIGVLGYLQEIRIH